MQKKNRYLTLLILLFLILSACSDDQGTGPSLIEISSDEDIKPDEDSDEESNSINDYRIDAKLKIESNKKPKILNKTNLSNT